MAETVPVVQGCMQDWCRCRRVRALAYVWLALAISMVDFVAAAQQARATNDQVVAETVTSYFASLPGYHPGDLITRSQIEKVITSLESTGIDIRDATTVAKRGVPDDSFLVREFSTASGRRFMRKLAQYPSTFAHIDRLSTIPRGETLVRDLVRMKDGDKMVQYLATTKGGQHMGGMMAQARGGVDLNKPTGRIYTADDLIAALNAAVAK